MNQIEVKFRKLQGPTCLPAVEFLGRHEVLQVLVVREDVEGLGRAVEVAAPFGQCAHDGQQLAVVDLVVALDFVQ